MEDELSSGDATDDVDPVPAAIVEVEDLGERLGIAEGCGGTLPAVEPDELSEALC